MKLHIKKTILVFGTEHELSRSTVGRTKPAYVSHDGPYAQKGASVIIGHRSDQTRSSCVSDDTLFESSCIRIWSKRPVRFVHEPQRAYNLLGTHAGEAPD